ncbi:MAG: class I SAM-dependent methyltransferase [Caulobacteraceae bacterium]
MTDQRAHWDGVYAAKRASEVSWFQSKPELSLRLVRRTGVSRTARVIDVGAGASMLVDFLVADGFTDVSVLDIASPALDQARARLGDRALNVGWIVADITAWRTPKTYHLWHDRAVLHFLVEPSAQSVYADVVRAAVAPDGWVIIGGFAPGGPVKCSGLSIVQHDATSLGRLLGDDFQLMETHGEVHVTPWGADQAFRYHLFRRKA